MREGCRWPGPGPGRVAAPARASGRAEAGVMVLEIKFLTHGGFEKNAFFLNRPCNRHA